MLRTLLFKFEIDFRLSLESSEAIISSWVVCMLSRSFAIWLDDMPWRTILLLLHLTLLIIIRKFRTL